jgi:uncharacterized protein YlbG (UPF0298 family)
METKYGVEYYPNENEGSQWQELDPIDFIRLVQKSPDSNVDYDYESKTFTFWDEYGVYYG